MRPAVASMIPSYSRLSNLLNLVLTLPRSSFICRVGYAARTWHCRRRLDVPIIAFLGSSANLAYSFDTKASEGSSRSQITPNCNPDGNSIGTSFIECTAMSAAPSRIDNSSSLTNNPLPPTLAKGVSKILSPLVVIPISSTCKSE